MQLTYKPKMLTCIACGKVKPETEFYRTSYTDIPTNQCKTCINIKRKVMREKGKHQKFVAKEKQRSMGECTYQIKDWRDAMVFFAGCCVYCGKTDGSKKTNRLEREHMQPLSKCGETERRNIVPACSKCNRGRGNREWKAWYRAQTFYDAKKEARIQLWLDQ